jgi:hypothetical protein
MSRDNLTEIFGSQSYDDHIALNRPVDECVLAIDKIDEWGAAFILSIDESGAWSADCLRAQRRRDGRWLEMGASGSHGSGWPIPWSPPPYEWNRGEPLLVLASGGQNVDTGTAENQMFQAVVGFADPSVERIRIAQGRLERQIQVPSEARAFVIMSIGVGRIELQAFDSTQRKVGPARQIS